MRVVIFCDMEGVSCIETWEQVSAGKPFYEESRKLYTDEVNNDTLVGHEKQILSSFFRPFPDKTVYVFH